MKSSEAEGPGRYHLNYVARILNLSPNSTSVASLEKLHECDPREKLFTNCSLIYLLLLWFCLHYIEEQLTTEEI